jgi:YidC/Oxa1 family membrane protein insertase
MGQIFDFLIVNPMTNLLLWLYGTLGQSYVLAIIALTALIRLVTLPLTFKQQVASAKQMAMQPKLKELQEKYKGDPQALNAEMRKLGFNPLSGCLPLLIQFPILIGMYNAIQRTLALTPLSLLDLGKHVYGFVPNLAQLVPINDTFLGFMQLGSSNHATSFYLIPIIVVATTWLSNKLMTPPTTDSTMAQTNQMMQLTMPMMIGFFSLSTPIGLGIYWIVSNLIGVGQYYLTRNRMNAIKAQYGGAPAGGALPTGVTPPRSPMNPPAPPRAKVRVKNTGRVNRSASGTDGKAGR